MKPMFKVFCIAVFVLAFSMPVFAEETFVPKIGIVDIKQVVANSKEVKKIKKEQEANKKSIMAFIKDANKEISKEGLEVKKDMLRKQFSEDLEKKRKQMEKDYIDKITQTNDYISAKVSELAKKMGYDLIITKEASLYGGDDLTKEMIKLVK